MAVTFGRKSLSKPTPTRLANGIQVFTVIGSITLAWVGTASFIPVEVGTVIQSILGLLIGIGNGVKPFFGVETEQQEVPISEVTEMEVN